MPRARAAAGDHLYALTLTGRLAARASTPSLSLYEQVASRVSYSWSQGADPPMGIGDGGASPSPSPPNRGRGRGRVPDSGQIGDGEAGK
jgi:hypothetical protein